MNFLPVDDVALIVEFVDLFKSHLVYLEKFLTLGLTHTVLPFLVQTSLIKSPFSHFEQGLHRLKSFSSE